MNKPPDQIFTKEELDEIARVKTQAAYIINLEQKISNSAWGDENVVLAGGWLVNVLNNTPPKDVDIFILSNNNNEQYLIDGAERVDTPNYKNLSKITAIYNKDNVQIIFTTYITRKELIDGFDFEHCKISYQKGLLYINHQTYLAAKNKILIPSKTNPPTQKRIDRFLSRGYTLVK